MKRDKILYDQKLAMIKDILEEVSYDDATFGGFKAILTVEATPSEKYLDTCYLVISNLIKVGQNLYTKETYALHDKLVKREKKLHEDEAADKEQEQADDILQGL